MAIKTTHMNFEAYAFKNLHTKTRSHTVDCVKKGISDLCRIAIIDYVIIHNKSFELILTEDFLKK